MKKRGHELHQLENLNHLRGKMCITGLENVRSASDAVKANMRNKKHLEILEYEWNSNEGDTDNITSISTQHVQLLDALQPPPNISVLKVKGFGGERFPNWLQSQNSLKHVKSLTFMNCDNVEEIPSIDKSLPNCESLILRKINNLTNMNSLPPNLTDLKISSCRINSDALSTCTKCLVSLSKLKLSNIPTIESLPPREVLCSLKNLKSLTIKICYFLGSLGGIGALTSLRKLKLNGCHNLNMSNEPLPSSLVRLIFFDCSNVDVIISKSNLPVLRSLKVNNTTFKNQRGVLHVGHLACLEELSICGWDGRLEGLNSLTALCDLQVLYCPEIIPSSPMDKYAYALPHVTVDNLLILKLILSNESISSIETLTIWFFQGESSDDEVFQSLTSLESLFIYGSSIAHLPKNLKNHAYLRSIFLADCPNLSEFEELPMNLTTLHIKDCPTLTENLKNGGPYQAWFEEGFTLVKFPPREIKELVQAGRTDLFPIMRLSISPREALSISPTTPPSPIPQPPVPPYLHH